jgi:hypothetical protein
MSESSKKTIDDLRSVLFETIAAVKSGEMEIDRAKTISDLAQGIINTAKVEVEYAKATGATGSGFLEMGQIKGPDGEPLPKGITGVRQYRLK